MTTARDVTEARAIVKKSFSDFSDKLYNVLADDIAAALSERERETVERCCMVVCEYCASGSQAEVGWDMPKKFGYGHWVVPDEREDFAWVKCQAANIRADAARRETP